MSENLANILNQNNIPRDEFEEVLYKQILLIMFSQIAAKLKDKKLYQDTLSRLRKTNNERRVIQLFVASHLNLNISEDDTDILIPWILSFFRKSSKRDFYAKSFKHELLIKQKNKCVYCGVSITIEIAELEHQVPWTYVGDALKDNMVMACIECNREKGKNVNRGLKHLLLKKMM